MFTSFKIHTGKVEDLSLASIVIENPDGFDSVVDAMTSVHGVLSSLWTEKHGPRDCCTDHPRMFSYCPRCGRRVGLSAYVPDVPMMLEKLFSMSLDKASGYGFLDAFEEEGWDLFGDPVPETVTVANVNVWLDWDYDDPDEAPAPTEYMEWYRKPDGFEGHAWGLEYEGFATGSDRG